MPTNNMIYSITPKNFVILINFRSIFLIRANPFNPRHPRSIKINKT